MSVMYRFCDPAYADSCPGHAGIQFKMAVKYPGAYNDPDDFYQKSEYKDDLICGSIELYKAAGYNSLLDLTSEEYVAVIKTGKVREACKPMLVR